MAKKTTAASWIYVGPEYQVGIQTPPPNSRMIRPLDMSQTEITDLLAEYPQLEGELFRDSRQVSETPESTDPDATNL